MIILLLAWIGGWLFCQGNGSPEQEQVWGCKSIPNESGGWCWFQDPKAIRYVNNFDKTYITMVDTLGFLTVLSYNHSSNQIDKYVFRKVWGQDDHNCPSFLIQSDNKVVVFLMKHNANYFNWRISKNVEDITFFETEKTKTVAGERFTYPQPVQLSAENDKVYLFYRGITHDWYFLTSTDSCQTFGTPDTLTNFANWCYGKICSNDNNKIFMAFTHKLGASNAAPKHILFCYYRDDSLFQADGTFIKLMANIPILENELEKVYDSDANDEAWIWDIAIDDSDNPYMVFATFPAQDSHRYSYAAWNGLAWVVNDICYAGSYISDAGEVYYSPGIYLDHNSPDTIYFSQLINGEYEIIKGYTTNYGVSWSFDTLTTNSQEEQVRPVVIWNHNSDIKVLWMDGDYPSYLNFDTDIISDSDIMKCR